MNGRVDSGIEIAGSYMNELYANSYKEQDLSEHAYSREEAQLLRAIAMVIDYLNHGNSVEQLERMRDRAAVWCVDYYGPGYFSSDKPKHVLRVHPNLFDLKIPSYERLDSQPPPLVSDTNEDSGSDVPDEVSDMSTDDDDDDEVDASSTVSDPLSDFGIRLGDGVEVPDQGEIHRESFPAYAEPVLIPDAAIYRLLDVYDTHGVSTEQRRNTPVAQYRSTGLPVSMDYYPPEHLHVRSSVGRARATDEIRIRSMDLVESPIIFYLPSVVYGLSCLATDALYCYRMVCFGKQKLAECKAAQQAFQQLQAPQPQQQQRQQRRQQPVIPAPPQGPHYPAVPPPPQGYQQPAASTPLPRQQQPCNAVLPQGYHHPVVVAPPTGYRQPAAVAPLPRQQQPVVSTLRPRYHHSAVVAPSPGYRQPAVVVPLPQQHQPFVAAPLPRQKQPFGFAPPPQQQQQVYIKQHPRYQNQRFGAPPPQQEYEEEQQDQPLVPVKTMRTSAVTTALVAATVMGVSKRRRVEDNDVYSQTPSSERKRSRGRWRLFSLLSGSGKKGRKERSSALTRVQAKFWRRFRML